MGNDRDVFKAGWRVQTSIIVGTNAQMHANCSYRNDPVRGTTCEIPLSIRGGPLLIGSIALFLVDGRVFVDLEEMGDYIPEIVEHIALGLNQSRAALRGRLDALLLLDESKTDEGTTVRNLVDLASGGQARLKWLHDVADGVVELDCGTDGTACRDYVMGLIAQVEQMRPLLVSPVRAEFWTRRTWIPRWLHLGIGLEGEPRNDPGTEVRGS